MKSAPLSVATLLALSSFALAAPNIVVEGRVNTAGIITWPDIDDGDLDPNQDATRYSTTDCNSSRDRTFRIRNTGNQTLTVFVNGNSPSSTSSQFTFPNFPNSNFSIGAGNEREFIVRYRPVTTGRTTTIRIDSNDPDAESVYTFALFGDGRCGEIAMSGGTNGTSYFAITDGDTTPRTTDGTDFGTLAVGGGHVDRFFRISNGSGAEGLDISNARITGSGASHFDIRSLSTATNINPGNNRNFVIRFDPTSAGTKTAAFQIDTNDPNENPYNFTIRGVATAFPEIRVQGTRPSEPYAEILDGDTSPRQAEGTLFADTTVGGSRTSNFRIHNDGDGNLTLQAPTLTGSGASSFTILSFSTANIAPGSSRDFNIRFAPGSFGTKSATFSFGNNDSSENPFNFVIRGLGEAPEMELAGRGQDVVFRNISDGDNSPRVEDGTDFGNVNVSGTKAQHVFRITNAGNQNLNISGRNFSGTAAGDYGVSGLLAGNPFVNIGPGQNQEFTITFDPSTTGQRNATFNIDNNDPNEDPYSFSLRGVGIGAPEIRVQGTRPSEPFAEIADGDTSPRQAEGTLFADTDLGDSRTSNFRIHNDGDGALILDTPTLSGTGAGSFRILNFKTASLAPRERADFNIQFNPASSGTKTAVVSFANNDSNENPFNFTIRGLGQAPEMELAGRGQDVVFRNISDGDSSPREEDGTDFGNVNVSGTKAQHVFRISNTGNQNLNISGRNFSGTGAGDYSVSGLLAGNPFVNIGPGERQDFTITFDPSSTGQRNATFNIDNNDPNEDPYSFNLTGVGIGAPEIRVQGTRPSEPFAEIADGDTSPRQAEGTLFADTDVGDSRTSNFRIHNDGDGTLTLDTPTLSGTGAGSFRILNFKTVSLAPRERADFNIQFNPGTSGTKTAVVSFANNDSNENPFNFTIRGLAEAPEIAVLGRGDASQFGLIADGDNTPRIPDGTDFNTTGIGARETKQFRIDNVGNKNLRISARRFIGDADGEWSVQGLLSLGTRNIAAGESHFFNISFEPRNPGTSTVIFELRNDDPDEDPYTFTMTSEGVGEPDIRVRGLTGANLPFTINDGDTNPDQDVTRFGNVDLGDTKERDYRIVNDGTDVLRITSVDSSHSDFTLVGVISLLAPGERSDFVIRYRPTTREEVSAIITIRSNDPDSEDPYTFAVIGTGRAPDMFVKGGGPNFSQDIADGDTTPRPEDGTHFGEVTPSGGMITIPFQIRNAGNDTLVIDDKSLTGPHASDFRIRSLSTSPLNVTVFQGFNRHFEIEFDPSATGERNATVTLHNNDPSKDPYTFAIRGVGQGNASNPNIQVFGGSQAIANGDSTPRERDGTDFGVVSGSASPVTRTFRVGNSASAAALEIYGITSAHPDFTITRTITTPVEEGTPATFNVTYTPGSEGAVQSLITIFNNDSDKSPYTFTVAAEVEAENNKASFSISRVEITGNDGTIKINAPPETTLRLMKSTTLERGSWTVVPGFGNIQGTGSLQTLNLSNIIDPAAERPLSSGWKR